MRRAGPPDRAGSPRRDLSEQKHPLFKERQSTGILCERCTTGCGKSRSFYCINYRCKESELLGLPLCVLCFSIFSVVLSIEHFQFALIHFLRLDSSHVILNVFNSHVRAPSVGRVRPAEGALTYRNEAVDC